MQTILRYFMMIGFACLLVGCGATDEDSKTNDSEAVEAVEVVETTAEQEKNLTEAEKEELFTQFNAATEEVEVYDVDMALVVELTEGENKTVQRAELFGVLEESMVNLDMTAIETQGVNKNETHLYKSDKEVYIKENEADWVKATEEGNEYSQSDTSYSNVANSLDKVKQIVEVVELDDHYEVKYAGNGNAEIFRAFEEPFSLTLTGVSIEEAEMDLLFIIDKKTKMIEDVDFGITAEKDGVDLLLTVEIEYEDINDTQVDIPKEVIEEAS